MKGYVTKLCDVDSIQFPAELLQTHVDTQLIEKEINALSLRYAKQSAADCAAQGDIVRCKADEATREHARHRARMLFSVNAMTSKFTELCASTASAISCRRRRW